MSTGAKPVFVQQEGRESDFKYLASLNELRKPASSLAGSLITTFSCTSMKDRSRRSQRLPPFRRPSGYHKQKDGVFTCLWHNWKYSCEDGSCLSHPACRFASTR